MKVVAGNERKRILSVFVEGSKASQCPLKLITTGQSSPVVGNPLIFGFVFPVVGSFGAGLGLGCSPQTLRNFLTDFLKHRARPNTKRLENTTVSGSQ